jgi:hypothetical protein
MIVKQTGMQHPYLDVQTRLLLFTWLLSTGAQLEGRNAQIAW